MLVGSLVTISSFPQVMMVTDTRDLRMMLLRNDNWSMSFKGIFSIDALLSNLAIYAAGARWTLVIASELG